MLADENEILKTVRGQIKSHLQKIIDESSKMVHSLENKSDCLLCDLDHIKDLFIEIQSSASSFYLEAYLSPYTTKYVELSKAIHHLSERRHGALIVVERNMPAEPLLNQGVLVHAHLSASLIESIFYPGNPLHDGALLVRGNIIESASNVLPLSPRDIGTKKVGTRHLAALGLTELTDALVLVVSEETGKMSFAKDGTLYPISTEKHI
ncbi:sporulation-specific diadenylate cyclase CdaS [Metabacillus arenae]|uniref:Diadenylate cyclase n=1 Tax=Metabacillus arenae TaxID=2771434 RepID=A0A926RVM4_9BACI|nr:sporulation-specific diadenylate cyclase CdaS [Metabacillus arenae]MBD1379021.1 DNA integrity scanning protein DisA nucleotide-binding domain protein [Metabacillus arenae]